MPSGFMRMIDAGAAAAGDLAVGAFEVDVVVADAHVELAVGAPFEDEHAERVPGLVLVGDEQLLVGRERLPFSARVVACTGSCWRSARACRP